MDFKLFLNQLGDKLPFGISFNVSPDETWVDKYEVLPGFTLNLYNDVTVSEAWFGDIINDLNSKRSSEAQIEIKLLAARLKDTFPEITTLADAINLLFRSTEILGEIKANIQKGKEDLAKEKSKSIKEILQQGIDDLEHRFDYYTNLLNSNEFNDFLLNNSEVYEKIAQLLKLIESDLSVKWVITTFFLMSRFDAEWSFDKTARLPLSVIDTIYNFYRKELNKGVVSTEVIDDSNEEEEDLKKS